MDIYITNFEFYLEYSNNIKTTNDEKNIFIFHFNRVIGNQCRCTVESVLRRQGRCRCQFGLRERKTQRWRSPVRTGYNISLLSTTPASGSYNIGIEGVACPDTAVTGHNYGVRGIAGNSADGYNYGVMGMLCNC